MMRINRYLASCGVASRRACDRLVLEGRVAVNGSVAGVGTQVAEGDRVQLDGKPVVPREGRVVIALNKPGGVITTMSDPRGRPCVAGLVPKELGRLFPVGRLDGDTSGLLVLTDDGDLAHRLAHPRHKVPKRYRVTVRGDASKDAMEKLRRGVPLEDGPTLPAKVAQVERFRDGGRFIIEITEGRNRQVRRMCHAVRLTVVELVREGVGGVELGELAEGKWRVLTGGEVATLMGGKDHTE